MAVWDLNSNLDVFSMQTFLRGLIYVRWEHIMDPGSHVGFQISTKNTNLVEDHPVNISGKFGWNLFSGFREEDLNVKGKNNFKLFVTSTMYLFFLEIYIRVCKVPGLWQFTIKHSTPPIPNQAGIPYPTLGDVLGSSVDWANRYYKISVVRGMEGNINIWRHCDWAFIFTRILDFDNLTFWIS
jgi:hypothetical protein